MILTVFARHSVAIDDKIRIHDPDPNVGAEFWPRLATVGMTAEPVVEVFNTGVESVGSAITGFAGHLVQNLRRVRIANVGDDDPRRHPRRAASRAALRALCSSREMNSPRSSAPRPSSTRG